MYLQKHALFLFSPSTKYGRCKRAFQVWWWFHLWWLSAAVEGASALASVSLRPLEGMSAADLAAPGPDVAAPAALLKLCSGWQKPGAAVQGQCVLVSPGKFEVDVAYHVDAIAAFKQMPTKHYGKGEEMLRGFCFVFLTFFFFFFLPDSISPFLLFCVYLLQI